MGSTPHFLPFEHLWKWDNSDDWPLDLDPKSRVHSQIMKHNFHPATATTMTGDESPSKWGSDLGWFMIASPYYEILVYSLLPLNCEPLTCKKLQAALRVTLKSTSCSFFPCIPGIIGLVYGNIYRNPPYFIGKNHGFRWRFSWRNQSQPVSGESIFPNQNQSNDGFGRLWFQSKQQ